MTASAESNPDLFWALRGGGPGAWGVIVSFTMKTFPTMKVAGAVIQYEITAGNTTQFWAAVKAVHKYAPLYADNNLSGYYGMSAGKFSLSKTPIPGFLFTT